MPRSTPFRATRSRPGRRAFLAAAGLLAAAALLAPTTQSRAAEDVISPTEAHARAQQGELTIIDVRSPQEWRETGVAQGAKTVTIHNPAGLQAFLADLEETLGPDKDQAVAFICASGVRSSAAQRVLRRAGYRNVMNIQEGMLGNSAEAPGWIARDLPTEPCPDC